MELAPPFFFKRQNGCQYQMFLQRNFRSLAVRLVFGL